MPPSVQPPGYTVVNHSLYIYIYIVCVRFIYTSKLVPPLYLFLFRKKVPFKKKKPDFLLLIIENK